MTHLILKRNKEKKRKKSTCKKAYCIFCQKGLFDLTHHLKRLHSDESSVQEALSFPEKSKERRRSFQKIRNEGNRKYENLMNAKIIPMRSPTKSDTSKFLRCSGCSGYIVSYNYSRHVRSCCNLPANYQHHQTEAKKLQYLQTDVDNLYDSLSKEILAPLRNDEEAVLIETDIALRAYAAYYCVSSKTTVNKAKNVRSHLRLLARLFFVIQSLDNTVMSFEEVLNLQKYPLLILGTMKLVGFNISTNDLKKLVHLLCLKVV